MASYAHDKTNILLSVLCIFLSFFMILTGIHNVLYTKNLLSINWASKEMCQSSWNDMHAYLLYSCLIYRYVKAFFLYRNQTYIFPILGLPKTQYSNPYYLIIITKTCLFEYIENFTTKNWKFSDKNSDIFHIIAQNIDCGHSLEPPRRGDSIEYPPSKFSAEIRKIMYTPVNPSFTIKGVKII